MTRPVNTQERIGNYVLEGELGRGAMGSVYLARHEVLGRRAAVKVLLDTLVQDQTLVQRFIQEAQIVNAIQHPNIIDVFEFHYSESPRRLAYVMEYVGAKPLHEVARHLSLLQAFTICRQIASALAAVHSAGVVHRDLKPDNILIELAPRFEAGPIAKLADFGIAKVRGPGRPNTDSGRVIGTPAYMAPEQIASGEVDGQADIYAFGAILFELFTGARLFSGDATQMMHAKLAGHAPPLDLLDGRSGGQLVRPLVEACLQFDPRARPTAGDLVQHFDHWLLQGSIETHATLTRVGTPTPWPLPSQPSVSQTVPVLGGGRMTGWVAGAILAIAGLGLVAAVQKTYAYVNAPQIVEVRSERSAQDATAVALAAQDVPPLPIAGIGLTAQAPTQRAAPRPSADAMPRTDAQPNPTPMDHATDVPSDGAEAEAVDDEHEATAVEARPTRTRRTKRRTHRSSAAARIEKKADTGRVSIEAWTTAGEPVQASVWVAGKRLPGQTPMIVDLAPGEYALHLESDAHPAYDERVSVEADATTKLYAVVDLEQP